MSPRAAWDRLSDRNRRALSIGAAVVGLVLAWTGAVSPWMEAAAERRDRLASQRELLRAERDLLASDEVYREAVTAAAARLRAISERLLAGRSEGAAAASLEQLVRDRAMAHRVLVTETAPRPAERVGDVLMSVGLSVHGESDLEGVAGLLASLEGGPTMLRVSDLTLRRAAGPTGAPGALAFRVAVTGFLLSPDDEAGEGAAPAAASTGPADGYERPDLPRGARR